MDCVTCNGDGHIEVPVPPDTSDLVPCPHCRPEYWPSGFPGVRANAAKVVSSSARMKEGVAMPDSFIDRHGRRLTLATEASLMTNSNEWLALVTTVVECEFLDERLNVDDFINSLDRWAQDCMNVYLPSDNDHSVCRTLYRWARKIKKELELQ